MPCRICHSKLILSFSCIARVFGPLLWRSTPHPLVPTLEAHFLNNPIFVSILPRCSQVDYLQQRTSIILPPLGSNKLVQPLHAIGLIAACHMFSIMIYFNLLNNIIVVYSYAVFMALWISWLKTCSIVLQWFGLVLVHLF